MDSVPLSMPLSMSNDQWERERREVLDIDVRVGGVAVAKVTYGHATPHTPNCHVSLSNAYPLSLLSCNLSFFTCMSRLPNTGIAVNKLITIYHIPNAHPYCTLGFPGLAGALTGHIVIDLCVFIL